MTQIEHWKRIPSLPGYFANDEGMLMRAPNIKPLPLGGYRKYGGQPTYGWWDGNRFVLAVKGVGTFKVARLVCEAFHGPPQSGQVCIHIDEDSRNNKPSNLAWGSQKENLNFPKFIAYCRSRTGENNPTKKRKSK